MFVEKQLFFCFLYNKNYEIAVLTIEVYTIVHLSIGNSPLVTCYW